MTDKELMAALRADTPMNRARREFSAACARIEQSEAQGRPEGPLESRRREFDAVARIKAALDGNEDRSTATGAPQAREGGTGDPGGTGTTGRRCGTCAKWIAERITTDGIAPCDWDGTAPFWARGQRPDRRAFSNWTEAGEGIACATWEPRP